MKDMPRLLLLYHRPHPNPPFRGRYFERAPKLRLEFGCHTKFESTSERKYLYHKWIGSMETNGCKTYATSQCSSNECIGTLEFWDGHLTLVWPDLSIKQSRATAGGKGK